MASVIDSFLINIGFDADTDELGKVDKAMDGIKSRALQLGAALATGLGFTSMLNTVSEMNAEADKLGKLGHVLGTNAQQLDKFAFAYGREGGGLGELISDLEQVNKLRAQVAANPEMMADLLERSARTGFDLTAALSGPDAFSGLRAIMQQGEGLQGNRLQSFRDAFGLSDVFTRLSKDGTKAFDAYAARAEELGIITNKMATDAAAFNDSVQDLNAATRAHKLLITEGLTGAVQSLNERVTGFLSSDSARSITRDVAGVAKVVVDNAEEIAAAVGIAVALSAAKKGIPFLLGLAGGPFGLALGGFAAAQMQNPNRSFSEWFDTAIEQATPGGGPSDDGSVSLLDRAVPLTDSDVPLSFRDLGISEEDAGAIMSTGATLSLDEARRLGSDPRFSGGGFRDSIPNQSNAGSVLYDQKRVEININGGDPAEVERTVKRVINRSAQQARDDMTSSVVA